MTIRKILDDLLGQTGKVLAANGCECLCDHHPDERSATCAPLCLACSIGEIVTATTRTLIALDAIDAADAYYVTRARECLLSGDVRGSETALTSAIHDATIAYGDDCWRVESLRAARRAVRILGD